MKITITPKAEKFISRMIRFNGAGPEHGFRLSVSPGGCSGLSSSFTIEPAPMPGDSVLQSNGVKLYLPAESRILLEGVTIDFTDTAMSTGLSFINPNAQACGCASSGVQTGPQMATVSVASILRKN